MSNELDGIYHVSSVTNYNGPLERKSDGLTEIRNGRTERRDDNNVLWTSTFEVLNEREVKMISVADPREAKSDFALNRPDGSPTREPVTYEGILRYSRKEDRVQLSGQLEYGDEIIFLTMRSR